MREEISLNYQNNDLLSKLSSRGFLKNIAIEILKRLSMKDLKAAELTCSSWRKLIIEEEIFHQHLGNIFKKLVNWDPDRCHSSWNFHFGKWPIYGLLLGFYWPLKSSPASF